MKTKTAPPQPEERQPLSSSELLGERRALALKLRNEGMTYKEIGKRMDVGAQRARELHRIALWKMEHQNEWWAGLSVRAANCLNNRNLVTRDQIMEAVKNGTLHPKNRNTRNYGWKSHAEVCKWLGLPEPQKSKPRLTVCPHCGGKLA